MNDLPELPIYGFAPDLGGLLGLVLNFVLPLIAGLLMKQSWSGGAKGAILLAVTAIKGFVEAWLMAVNKDVPFDAVPVIYTIAVSYVIAVAAHYGLWRGTGVQRGVINSGVADRTTR